MGSGERETLFAFLRDWTRLHAEAESFASTAFDNGHYPNPIGHGFAECSICQAAHAAGLLRHRLEAVRDAR